MLSVFSMILPILVPSWRFFKSIEPAPRIEWRHEGEAQIDTWTELFPRPPKLRAAQHLAQLFWNPQGNERLYMVSCAERVARAPCPKLIAEITDRVSAAAAPTTGVGQARFRIVFQARIGCDIQEEVLYRSPSFPTHAPAPP